MNTQERRMLLDYTYKWNELAKSYLEGYFFTESAECLYTSAIIYDKLLMYPHLAVCLGDFYYGLTI